MQLPDRNKSIMHSFCSSLSAKNCVMRPPIFLFGTCPKRKTAPRPVEERKGRFQGRRAFCATPFARGIASLAALPGCLVCEPPGCACRGRRPQRLEDMLSASRGPERAAVCVRNTGERQRHAGSASTSSCFSGDPDSSLRLPSCARGQGEPSPCRLSLECKNRFFPRTGKKRFLIDAAYLL